MSLREIEGNRRGGFDWCFPGMRLVADGSSKAVGMKNDCLKDLKESPHFTRPNSMDR